MARLDVFKNPGGPGYLVDIQTNLLNHTRTRIVVPLLPAEGAPAPARELTPVFDILGTP